VEIVFGFVHYILGAGGPDWRQHVKGRIWRF